MAIRVWKPIKSCFCHHINQDVSLEAEVVFPAEWLPDQSPRILAHRCSLGLECNQDDRASCVWSGTNPAVDPFI